MWEGSSSLGEDGYIFFHILDSGYGSPRYIRFWQENWINTDAELPTYPVDVADVAIKLVEEATTRSKWYRHNQILIPFGSDFAHQNAEQSMVQMGKLIDYINDNVEKYNATIQWSTLADYIKVVNSLNLTWPLERSDFFTYVDSPHGTSRCFRKL